MITTADINKAVEARKIEILMTKEIGRKILEKLKVAK